MPASYFVGIRLVHVGLGVLSCLLVYALARHAFGEQVGRIAGIMAALCGSLLYFEGELLAVPWKSSSISYSCIACCSRGDAIMGAIGC